MKTMTPRQRWLARFEGGPVDRLPTDYWATGEFTAKLKAHLSVKEDEALWKALSIDRPVAVSAAHKPGKPLSEGVSMWGVKKTDIDYGTGSYSETAEGPLANATTVDEVLAYAWPSPDDFDYSGIASAVEANDGYRWVMGGWYEPFLLYCELRGMEKAYEDLLLDPEIAEAALTRIFETHFEINRRTWEAGKGKIDCMYLAEDLGGQTTPLFSVEVYRRFLMPNQRRMAALAKLFGVRVFYHTDGSARPFVPDLVNGVGIDLINPLQWRCPGMELPGLVAEWGHKLVFHGGIDNQHTLPFGTPDDVRRQVREIAGVMRGKRWICAPCHNIQNVSPVENVIAMYEEAGRVSEL